MTPLVELGPLPRQSALVVPGFESLRLELCLEGFVLSFGLRAKFLAAGLHGVEASAISSSALGECLRRILLLFLACLTGLRLSILPFMPFGPGLGA